MRDLFKQILDEMKVKVMKNLSQVKENEVDMRKLLMNRDTYKQAFDLQMHFGKNRKLLSENLEYLELQLKIVNLVSKYGRTEFMKTPFDQILSTNTTNVDYFTETISGNIFFDKNHPYFNDEVFIAQLLNYYEKTENYEECKRLNDFRNNQVSDKS